MHFLEDTLGWIAVILMALILRFTDWYILDPSLVTCHLLLYLVKSHSTFWSTLKIFLDAVPEGVNIQKIETDLAELEHVASINQLIFGPWTAWEKMLLSMFVWSMSNIWRSVKSLSETCSKRVAFKILPSEVDEDLATHRAHKRNIEELELESEQEYHH